MIGPLKCTSQLDVEFNLRRKSGDSIVADGRLSLLRNGDGSPIGVIGYLIDVTHRKAAEEALRRSEERLRRVVTNAPIVFFALDERGAFTLSEGKGLETLGLKPGEVVGQAVTIPLISRGRLVGVITYASRLPHYFTSRDVAFDVTVADLFAVAIENAHLYEEVRQALRLREEFIAAAAHELRTPITVIRGNSQLLLKTDADDPRVRRSLETSLRHSDRVTLLVDDLLTIAKVRPGLVQLNRSTFDLGSLVRLQSEAVARTTERHQFGVDDGEPLPVDADRQLIVEVIRRLLENALRYSPDGGSIQVSARKQNHLAIVSVTDQGVGIPIERQSHAFEPFYELVPAGLPGYVGMVSLGLTVSKQIVDAHGGRIRLRSAPGQGLTFSFSLPLVSAVT